MIFIATICFPKEQFVERTVIQVALLPRLTVIMTLPIPCGWGLGQGSLLGPRPPLLNVAHVESIQPDLVINIPDVVTLYPTVNISLNYFTHHRNASKSSGQSLYTFFFIAFFVAFAPPRGTWIWYCSLRKSHIDL